MKIGSARLVDVHPKVGAARDRGVDAAAIWRKHKEELIRFATVVVGVDQAEDVLSTVVERVLRGKGSLTSEGRSE